MYRLRYLINIPAEAAVLLRGGREGGGGKRRLARGSGIFSWKIIRGWDSGGPGWLSNCGGGGEEQVQSP